MKKILFPLVAAFVLLAYVPWKIRAASNVYVTNSGSDNVAVIDVTDGTTTSHISVGNNPVGMVITPGGAYGYVPSLYDNNVSVIDLSSGIVTATVPVGGSPGWQAITPDGAYVYVTNQNTNDMSVISTATNTVIATVPLGSNPDGVTVTPDGQYVYVSNYFDNTVSVVRTDTNTVINTFGVGTHPQRVQVSPDGARAYTANAGSNDVSVIDTATNTVIATVPVGSDPAGIAFTADSAYAYVTNFGGSYGTTVSRIDTATNLVTGTVTVPQGPHGITTSPDGSGVYVGSSIAGQISVIDPVSNMVTATWSAGGVHPADIDFPVPANHAPSVGAISAPADPVPAADQFQVSAAFTDPDIADTHIALWDWGDGTVSAGSVTESAGSGTVTGVHTYAGSGVYEIRVTVTDNRGKSGSAVYQYIVAYDSSTQSGFVTGSGAISSPAGAYAADPSLTGVARFGFFSKYKPGATVPDGRTSFHFLAAGLRFDSTAYQWLVVSGPQAKFKGSGTVNGSGTYGFLISGIDGSVPGGGGTDTFRIKIWDQTDGTVIYDNEIGSSETADPTTELTGGKIIIHH